MATSVTSANTKAQILSAYKEAIADAKEKDKQLRALRQQLASAGKSTRDAPAEGSPDTVSGVVASLNSLSDGFGTAISALSGTLTEEATRLAALRKNVDGISKELVTLHNIEVGEGTLDQMIEDLQNKIEAHDEAQTEERATFDEDLNEKRNAFKKEREERSALVKERDESLRKARKRENDEFKYDINLARKLEDDEYDLKQKKLDRELADMREASDKALAEAEAEIAGRENEVAEAKDKAEKLSKEFEGAVKKARDEGTAIANRQSKIKADLTAKEHEGRRRVYELRITTMEETIAKQNAQIQSLSSQLTATLKQAQDLAVKAIEGASNATSFDAIREIALEQAKHPQKGK